ncbi:hypothetical protein FQA39_LY13182 [Lamprigera yunnana]|nr:hypothetical protein FQA39_LY13182 [Lamprigera yunnana]
MNNDIQEVMLKLEELFGDIFDTDVIHSVASSCKYNSEVTSNALLEMMNSGENINTIQENINVSQRSSTFSYANAASMQKSEQDVIIEAEKLINSDELKKNIKSIPNVLMKTQQKTEKELEFDRILRYIREELRVLIFMRGLPGSGKSYLARSIIDHTFGSTEYYNLILSTDDYFLHKSSGTYRYDPSKIQEAHEWNQQRAYKQMSSGISPVIIDNTNTQMWEMKAYAMMAANFGYIVEIVEPFTPWAFDVKQLYLKNKHKVPKMKINEMLLRYEKNITPINIFLTYNLSYLHLLPPIRRSYPPSVVTDIQHKRNNEDVDLMNFDEDLPKSNVSCTSDDSNESDVKHFSTNSYLIDSILINSHEKNENILKPSIRHNTSSESPFEVKKVCTSENTCLNMDESTDGNELKSNVKKARDVYPTLNLSSWGLPEDAVSTWELWDMVTPLNNADRLVKSDKPEVVEVLQKVETSNSSTNTSHQDFVILDTVHGVTLSEVKTLDTKNRNINVNTSVTVSSPPKRILLDKSCMTEDGSEEDDEQHLEQLISLFPTIPCDYLLDVYEKCKKNINWAVDLLLDDSKEIFLEFEQNDKTDNIDAKKELNVQESAIDSTETKPISSVSKESNNNYLMHSQDLKRHIESRIEINKDLYSEHVMKIRNSKYDSGHCSKLDQPSTSKALDFEVYPTTSGDMNAINTNMDVNDWEEDAEILESEELQTIELNLGDMCIKQMESLFGLPEMLPKGFQPTVQVPIEFAEQLHAFYIQSIFVQMEVQNSILDMIVKEDEELARKLQEQDRKAYEEEEEEEKAMEFEDIIKEQVADKKYQRKINEWKKLTPDTLAAKLTIQKLVTSFPTVDKNTLMEILHAHNNSYTQTIEVLLASTDVTNIHDPEGNIREPPLSDTLIRDMNNAQAEKVKEEQAWEFSKSANEYRNEANKYHRKHNAYVQKAQTAFQSKQYAVARFYSDLAKSYTSLYEQCNSLAASAFLQEHSQNFHKIDLHYLYIKEAIPALDMFLDSNIVFLADAHKQSKNLFIITGRGKRSVGKAKLKPAVMAHLRKRKLGFESSETRVLVWKTFT